MCFMQDIIGKRGVLAVVCAVFTIPVFILLAFTEVHPLVATLALGATYSFAAVRNDCLNLSYFTDDDRPKLLPALSNGF